MPAASRRDREKGQALVEFAIVLGPLLLLISGIIYFGIALNYWLDMQRIANQGARWAAVNNWPPDCPRGSTSCTLTPPCDAADRTGATLQNTLRCQALTNGLRDNVLVEVCYPDTTLKVGDPVAVKLSQRMNVVPLIEWRGLEVTLKANATMRLEQEPKLITGAVTC